MREVLTLINAFKNGVVMFLDGLTVQFLHHADTANANLIT